MNGEASAPPRCPVTGLPAVRAIQTISSRFLIDLWHYSFGVSTARQLARVHRFGLWESPCGLAFFEPMIAGDAAFYEALYQGFGDRGPWTSKPVERSDYRCAAAVVRPGDSVLDVGCGAAGFARHVPYARYVGLEQSAEAAPIDAEVRTETIAEHAAAHGGAYDLVCAFHVIEHIVEPLAFCRDLLLCLRPGGRLVLAVPSWPSAMTAIPNFALNAPPHHQSWWTIGALRALAERFGLLVEAAEVLPPSDNLKLAYWMARVAPKLTGERFFRHAWSWHLALAWSWIAGWVCDRLFGMPTRAQSLELLLIARKPE